MTLVQLKLPSPNCVMYIPLKVKLPSYLNIKQFGRAPREHLYSSDGEACDRSLSWMLSFLAQLMKYQVRVNANKEHQGGTIRPLRKGCFSKATIHKNLPVLENRSPPHPVQQIQAVKKAI